MAKGEAGLLHDGLHDPIKFPLDLRGSPVDAQVATDSRYLSESKGLSPDFGAELFREPECGGEGIWSSQGMTGQKTESYLPKIGFNKLTKVCRSTLRPM